MSGKQILIKRDEQDWGLLPFLEKEDASSQSEGDETT